MKAKEFVKEAITLPLGVADQAVQYISGPMLPKPGGQYRLQDVLKRVKEIKDSIARAKQSGRLDVNSTEYKNAVAEIKKWAEWLEASQAPARPGDPVINIEEATGQKMKIKNMLETFEDLPDDLMNPANWKNASLREKFKALVDAGIIEKPIFSDDLAWMNNTPLRTAIGGSLGTRMPTDDDMPFGLKDGTMDLNQIYRDALKKYKQEQHANALASQEQDYEINLGPEGRAELQAKAEELAEMRRQQLRAEKLEDEQIAYERYKDKAEREVAMKKIEMEYKHDLEMVNTEHRNNMEAIRTGNNHEINKMNMDYAEAARERQHELEKEKMRQQQQQAQRERPQRPQRPRPEPEDYDDDEDEEPGEPSRPQAPAGPGLAAPAKPPKPSRYDTTDATDVEFTEKPRPPKPGKPSQLPGPANEAIERLKQLAGR